MTDQKNQFAALYAATGEELRELIRVEIQAIKQQLQTVSALIRSG